MIRRLAALLLAVCLCLGLTACGEGDTTATTTVPTTNRTTVALREEGAETAYPNEKAGFQTEAPKKGEQIAVLHTDAGDLYVRLFPEAAPKAVSNFVELANKGYYNGVIFHTVKQYDYVQTGDPSGTGTGGASADGTPFADEFDTKLLNLYGAVSMASAEPNQNGSQFIINQKNAEAFGKRDYYTPEYREKMAQDMYKSALEQTELSAEEFGKQYGITKWQDFITDKYVYDWIPAEVWDAYEKYGGNVRLDGAFRREGGNTVFGQVFKGLDVLEEIANTVTDSKYRPVVKLCIKTVEITTYNGE